MFPGIISHYLISVLYVEVWTACYTVSHTSYKVTQFWRWMIAIQNRDDKQCRHRRYINLSVSPITSEWEKTPRCSLVTWCVGTAWQLLIYYMNFMWPLFQSCWVKPWPLSIFLEKRNCLTSWDITVEIEVDFRIVLIWNRTFSNYRSVL